MGTQAPEQKALPTTPGPRRLELVVDGGGGLVSQNDLETPPIIMIMCVDKQDELPYMRWTLLFATTCIPTTAATTQVVRHRNRHRT